MYTLKSMKGLVTKGKVSRRDFVQFAVAVGISVAAAETMFVEAAHAEPKRGGHLRMGLASGSTTDTLDPAFTTNVVCEVGLWGTLSNSLTQVDGKGDIVLDLVEEMEPSDKART